MSHQDDESFRSDFEEFVTLVRACEQAQCHKQEAHAKWTAATERFAANEVGVADVTEAREHLDRAATDLRACHRALWKHEEIAARGYDEELRVAFESNANWLALHTALEVVYEHPVDVDDAPFQTEMYFVPEWVMDACYRLVTEKLSAPAPQRGARRWLTRYRQSLKDQDVWVVFQWCQQKGLSYDEAKAASAEYLEMPEDTVDKAVRRVKAIRDAQKTASDIISDQVLPVFKPIYPNGFGDVPPFGKCELNSAPLSETLLEAFLNAVAQTTPTGDEEGTQTGRARRLIEVVSSRQRAR